MIIYYYRNATELTPEHLGKLIGQMPQQQQDIVARYKSHRQKCEQAIAYTMLCHALQNEQGLIIKKTVTISEFPLSALHSPFSVHTPLPLWNFGEHGKPYITNYEGIHFNISHCREAVAVAVSVRKVGIDVEGCRQYSDTLLQRAFNDEEQAAIKASDIPESEFARLWTRKEAWFKYTGTGILLEHLKTTEDEARTSGCTISTVPVNIPEPGDALFWLSWAEDSE